MKLKGVPQCGIEKKILVASLTGRDSPPDTALELMCGLVVRRRLAEVRLGRPLPGGAYADACNGDEELQMLVISQ
jgi:hypothetical protein